MITAKLHYEMTRFPALTSLDLGREHLAALAQQGSLHAEGSCQNRPCYKLRFRMGTKQYVRYVGNSPGFVAQVQRELTRLQADKRSAQELRRLVREANECLRRTKHLLMPFLPLAGRCFYGREIRWKKMHEKTRVGGLNVTRNLEEDKRHGRAW